MKKLFVTAVLFSAALILQTRALAQTPAEHPSASSVSPGGIAPSQQPEAAGTLTITGTVRTPQGVPVPGANVQLLHIESGKAWQTWSNEEGKFSVPDVPAGHYSIEARQLGVGTAALDSDVKSDATGNPTAQTKIDLILRRKAPAEKPVTAETAHAVAESKTETAEKTPAKTEASDSDTTTEPAKKHHTRKSADDSGTANAQPTGAAPSNPAPANSESAPAEIVSANAAKSEKPATKSAKSGASNSGSQKSGKSRNGGFEQVEATGVLTADSNPGEGGGGSAASNPGQTGQYASADAYMISGAIGRGSTADGTDTNDPNNLGDSAADNGSGSPKKTRRNSQSGSHRSRAAAGPADNLAGGVGDLAIQNKIKHLGSNQVHLTLYDYYDSSVWDARPYALSGGPFDKNAHYSDRFGANVGGRLSIPHVYNGADRTFWFFNYELNRRRDPVDLDANVPTASERTGNFCDRPGPTPNSQLQLFDPLTGLAGPRHTFGCAIPTSRLDPAAIKLMALIPLPNLPGFNLNFHRAGRSPQAVDLVNFRILHSLSARFTLSGAFNLVVPRGDIANRFPSLDGNSTTRDQNITIGLTQNWTPRLINETKINFNRNRNQAFSTNAFTNDLAAQDGVTGVSQAPIDFGAPGLTFANFQELADPAPLLVRNQTLRFMDNISYTLPKHTLRVGAEIRRRQLNTYTDATPRGVYSFTGLMTSQLDAAGKSNPTTGLDFADFLLGLPETTNVQFGTSSNYGRSWQFATYAQDDWRVKPRFSVNFGLRYEFYTPFVEKQNHIANLLVNPNVTQIAVAVPGQPNALGENLPNSLVRSRNTDIAPRLGIAWKPFAHGGPVVRAGYGMFYNGAIYDQIYSTMLNQPPWAQSRSLVTSASHLLTLENGFPPSALDAVTNTTGVDPNYKVGYAQIWNLSFENQIGSQYVIELLYTGTKGTHLDLLSDPNQAAPGSAINQDQRRRIPTAPGFDYETSGGDSIYNGFQARLQRRMSNGFRLLFLYTLGHSIDDAGVIGVGHIVGLVQDYNNLRAERGNSFFDVRNDVRTTVGYDLPFGDRRRWLRSGVGAKLLGNWQLTGITQYSSGNHLTPYITAQNTSGVGPLFSQRPDMIGDPNLPAGQRTNTRFFNTSAFSLPKDGQFGNAPRGSIVGPSVLNVNLAITRRIHFGPEGEYTFELRWETQNLLNTPNFANIITVVDATDAGLVTGVKPMRTMDLLLRLHF